MEANANGEQVKIDLLVKDGAAIDAAIKRAVHEALLMHGRAGNPVAVWRDDKVVWLQADEALNELGEENGKRDE
ncbi:MAG: hypothetical protein MSG64_04440 [Pyrinomonadaceae bacterium MAG19_C2-C3]|nr:hypothetical protein [Pyrinomonadaceae bacterium MAG19_C2-C3]